MGTKQVNPRPTLCRSGAGRGELNHPPLPGDGEDNSSRRCGATERHAAAVSVREAPYFAMALKARALVGLMHLLFLVPLQQIAMGLEHAQSGWGERGQERRGREDEARKWVNPLAELTTADLQKSRPGPGSSMPLQSRGKGRRGVKQQQQRNAAESQAKVMYRKAALEVDMLNEHMVPWRGMAWQASTDHEGLKRRLRDLEKALEQAREDKRDMHEAMARQYQELQEQTASRRRSLEMEVKSLQEQLAASLRERQLTQEMAAQALAEKDVTITQLQSRLDTMEMEYEKILHGSLDLVLAKLAGASQYWEEMGTSISLENKERLQEFGLNPLEI
ncbi:dynein regulatory complex protein 12 isoform X2 [Struthio camelus]|uniref:dynein regulatory complex protein 12 isoform X2 n=2 Tax=Struthio camelus TaxID=8801 RepID=UPI003603CBA6